MRRLPSLGAFALGLLVWAFDAQAAPPDRDAGAKGPVEGPEEAQDTVPPASPIPKAAEDRSAAPKQLDGQRGIADASDPIRAIFELPPSARDDSYGPRPAGAPQLTREQIIRYALENPYVKAADEHIEAMEAQLRLAKFAWVPTISASAVLTPGAAISCDDVTLQGESGPFSFQFCRSTGDPVDGTDIVDIQTASGYFERIGKAGISLRMQADFVAPITTFGKIVTAQQLAKVAVELAELQKLATEHETLLRIYQAFSALQLARETIDILTEAWKIVQQEREKIEKDLGLGPGGVEAFDADPADVNLDRDPDDLTRLEIGEIELADRMREARLIESQALAALWTIAGNAAPANFDVVDQELAPEPVHGGLAELDHYIGLAMKNRPEARMADAGVKARKLQEKLARTNFLPDLGAVVRLGYGYANRVDRDMRTLYYGNRLNYTTVYFGLALSWDLGFHNDVFRLQKARAERREAEYQREAARALLSLEVENAYREVVDAEQRMRFTEIAREKAWKLVVSEQASSSVGAGNFEQMRKALTQWAEFEFKHFEAIMRRNTAVAKLARSVGTPLTEV